MAGVNMRLEAGSYRELHCMNSRITLQLRWPRHIIAAMLIEYVGHTAGEWALMLNGSARIQAINSDGQTFIDDVSKGDVWVCEACAHRAMSLGLG